MAAIYYTDDAGNEVRFDIPPNAHLVSIGRGAANDLRIRKPSISRRHAQLEKGPGGWTLTDLGSSNGSWVAGERLAPQHPAPLTGQDALKCGEVPLRFDAHVGEAPAPPPAMPPPVEAPPPIEAPPIPAAPPLPAAPAEPRSIEVGETWPPEGADDVQAPAPTEEAEDPLAGLDIPAPAMGSPGDPATPGDSLVDLFGSDEIQVEDVFADDPLPLSDAPDDLYAAPPADAGASTDRPPLEDEPALAEAVEEVAESEEVEEVPVDVDPPDMTDVPEPGSGDDPGEATRDDQVPAAMAIPDAPDLEAPDEPSMVMQAIGDAEMELFGAESADDSVLPPLPDLPEDLGARARILEGLLNTHRAELETKSRRAVSLQKAARRDVDTKKRLQDARKEAEAAADEAIRERDGVTAERDTLREDVVRLNGLLAAGEEGVSQVESQLQETRGELDAVRVERDDLARQNAVVRAELDERPTEEQVRALQGDLEEARGQLDVLTTERDGAQERAAEADSWERKAVELGAENDRLADALGAAPTPERYKEMELELRALRRDAGSGAGKATVLEKQLKDSEAAFAGFKAKARKTFNELATTLKDLEAEKDSVAAQLSTAQGALEAAESSGDDAAGKLSDLRKQVDTLTGDHADLTQALDKASARAEAAEAEGERLKGEVEDLQRRCEETVPAADAQATQEQLETLRGSHEGVVAELADTQGALAASQQRVTDLEGVVEASKQGQDAQLSQAQDEASSHAAAAAAAEASRDELAAELEMARGQTRTAEEARAEMEAELALLRQAGDNAAGKVEAEREESRRLEGELATAQEELASAVGKQEELSATIEALRMATAAGEGEGARQEAAPGGGSDTPDDVAELIDRINDVVSNWKNNFMHISNFLLDVRNGLETLKQEGADIGGSIEEMEASGTAEEMQDLMQRCEDDSRDLKRELRAYRNR